MRGRGRWLEGEGTAVPGRAVRWYPRGSSAAGVKIRERVEEIRYDRPNSLHRVDWKISGQGIFVGPSSFLLFSLPLSLSLSLVEAGKEWQTPASSDEQNLLKLFRQFIARIIIVVVTRKADRL